MKRDLFVFAGQSNMMGASVFPPRRELSSKDSFEYKHKRRRMGASAGEFVPSGYPVGEFSYVDLGHAYATDTINDSGKSTLTDYAKNTYFCPAMSNLSSDTDKTVLPFSSFSEASARHGATLAPHLAEEWERRGNSCAYAHIAKGGVSIDYYLTDSMEQDYSKQIAAYNEAHGTDYSDRLSSRKMDGAAEYFLEKCRDFFADAVSAFPQDEITNRCLFWLQGESDIRLSEAEYELKLDIFWRHVKTIGFTHFFCIRVDYFGNESIARIMNAQERFTARHSDAYMLTRSASYLTYPEQEEATWFVSPPEEEYRNCRDSFWGYPNHHINEKGFALIAERAAENLDRVLIRGQEPLLEQEKIRLLLQ